MCYNPTLSPPPLSQLPLISLAPSASLCSGFSSSTFQCEQISPILSWPNTQLEWLPIFSFTTNHVERVAPHFSFATYALRLCSCYHSTQTALYKVNINTLVPKSNGYFQSLPSLISLTHQILTTILPFLQNLLDMLFLLNSMILYFLVFLLFSWLFLPNL